MSVAGSVAQAAGAIDPLGAAERALDGLRAPVSGVVSATRGSAAIATALYGLATGQAAIGPRSAAALTAFIYSQPGPGARPRVFSFAIGPSQQFPDRPRRPSAGKR